MHVEKPNGMSDRVKEPTTFCRSIGRANSIFPSTYVTLDPVLYCARYDLEAALETGVASLIAISSRMAPTRGLMSEPKHVKIVHRSTGKVLVESARWCRSRLCRLLGLQFRRRLKHNEALLLVMAKDSIAQTSIHMFFVFFSIAAVWINNAGRVTHKQLAKPWRPYYASPEPAKYVLEISPTFLKEIKVGDEVDFVKS